MLRGYVRVREFLKFRVYIPIMTIRYRTKYHNAQLISDGCLWREVW